MYGAVRDDLRARLARLEEDGLLKRELVMTTPQGSHVGVAERGALLNLCANNYLGLANHPEMVAAAHEALDRWGYGMASVRFICGTQELHRDLEEHLSEFLGTEDTILFGSCFDANGGVFEALLDENAAVICDQAERHDALVLVDDSHAVGFVGPEGRGTHAQFDVVQRVDILTGTLGKAVGGASGGDVSGRQEVVDILRQRARPYLFSNSVAPVVVGASLRALDLIERSDDLRDRLWTNTRSFRTQMTELRFDVLPGDHPIVPVMVGDASEAARFSRALV